ncbi:MAG: sodium:solute symporter, partial [Bacteroidota bacterium]
GLFTKRKLGGWWVPVVCAIAPLLSFLISSQSATWFGGYKISIEILILNGAITYLGLWLISQPKKKS